MTNQNKTEREIAFENECEALNLNHEYRGYVGKEQWAIISDLSEKEIKKKYPDLIDKFMPFVLLTVEQGIEIKKFKRIEHKHEMRGKLYHDNYNVVGDDLEQYCPELITDHIFDEVVLNDRKAQLRTALNKLTPTQKKRVYKYYYQGKTLREIANEEDVCFTKIDKSIAAAIKKLKKLLL